MALTSIVQNKLAPQDPSLMDVLNLFKDQIFLDFSAHHIGTLQSFDTTNQTASATINYPKTFFEFNSVTGVYETRLQNYPVIGQCPVIVLGGGTASLTFPFAPGDECLVFFNDRDMDNWFVGGTGSPNATGRLHDFADALILVGLRSLPHVLANYDSTRAVLRNGNAKVGVGQELILIANEMQSMKTLLEGLTAKIDQVLTTGSVTVAPGPVSFTGTVASYNPTIEELLE